MTTALIALYVLPSLLAAMTVWTYRNDASILPFWRKAIVVCGLIANLVSSITLPLSAWYSLNHSQPLHVGLEDTDLALFGLALLGVPLALFGRRISRWVLLANGLLASSLWYFLLALMADSV